MGRFDNYNNRKNIEKAQKKLDKLTRKHKQDQFQIELAQRELDTAKLFSSCQHFCLTSYDGKYADIMFSDENRVVMFLDKLVPYDEIESCSIVGKKVTMSYTTTKAKGVIPRAVVGGAIAGGVGAIVGGMTAGSKSNTTYYETTDGFHFQLFLKNQTYYYVHLRGNGLLSNKVPPKWIELAERVQMIIDENNKE